MATSSPLLEFEDVTIRYRTKQADVTAVSDVSFTVDRGEYFGLVGESGCGKSTIAKSIIGGLDQNGSIESGTIRFDGEEIQDLSEQTLNERIRWKEISFIPQGSMSHLDPLERLDTQAYDIAKEHTSLSKSEALDRFREMLDTVGLPEDRMRDYPHQFSGGMQQRALIALALFLEPALIIADEPTTALDVIMQDQIFKYLDEIKSTLDSSMMLITHDISLVFESCDRLGIMHAGQLGESGHTDDLFNDPRHPYSILLQRAFPDIRYPDRDLEIIEGIPPQNMGTVDYCTFYQRCPWADEQCEKRSPPLESVTGSDRDHRVACFNTEDVMEDLD